MSLGSIPSSFPNVAACLGPRAVGTKQGSASDEALRLEAILLNDPQATHELIVQCLTFMNKFAILIRFCTSILALQGTVSGIERRRKLQVITDLFIKDSSPYSVSNVLDKTLVENILKRRDTKSLVLAKHNCLQIMVQDERVMRAIERLEMERSNGSLLSDI